MGDYLASHGLAFLVLGVVVWYQAKKAERDRDDLQREREQKDAILREALAGLGNLEKLMAIIEALREADAVRHGEIVEALEGVKVRVQHVRELVESGRTGE